jgi:hypothetical protein
MALPRFNNSTYLCGHCASHLDGKWAVSKKKDLNSQQFASVLCESCKATAQVTLPMCVKKVLYLDQSILSDMARNNASKSDLEKSNIQLKRILEKIDEAIRLQKLVVVISDTHFRETSAIPKTQQQTLIEISTLQNRLCDGRVVGDMGDAVLRDVIDALNLDKSASISNFHQFNIERCSWGLPPEIFPSNLWRHKLNDHLPKKETFNSLTKKIYESLETEVGSNATEAQCIAHIRTLTTNELQKAAKKQASDFSYDIERLMRFNEDSSIDKKLADLFSEGVRFSNTLSIFTALEGLLLKDWLDDRSKNDKKFNRKYGRSIISDCEHIAIHAPYVDYLTTDAAMQKFCEREPVNDALRKTNCIIIASKNYSKLENWLDSVLSSPEAPEFTPIRKSVFGLTADERNQADEQELSEIIINVGKILQSA